MKEFFTKRDVEILINYQYANTGYTFPGLRLVSVTLETNPEIHFFVHGAISDDDKESMNLIHTYFGVGFSSNIEQGSYDVLRIDAPTPIKNFPGECVYARKEQKPLILFKSKIYVDPLVNRRSKICLAAQQAMINHVFPELRSVYAKYDNYSICLTFIIDKELSEDNNRAINRIFDDFIIVFPEIIICDLKIVQTAFPTRITEDYGQLLIYKRKEYQADNPDLPYNVYQN